MSTSSTKWQETTLGEVAEKIAMGPFGSNIKIETFVSDGVPVISGAHLHGTRLEDTNYNFVSREHADRLSSANVRRGDVIFTHAGNIGQVAYIPNNSKYDRYILSQRQFYLRPSKRLSAEYLTYYFHSPQGRHQLFTYASQVGVPSIAQPVTNLKSTPIYLPPIEEQQSVVAVIACLDNKIDLLRRQNGTLEQVAQAIFNEWFVKPSLEGSAHKEWELRKVGSVMRIYDAERIPLASNEREKRRGQYPYYGATKIMDYIDEFLFDGIYLLLAEDGSVMDEAGYPVLQYISGQFWVSNHAHVLQGVDDFSTEILYLFFRQKKVSEIITGAVQLKINQKNLVNVEISVPPKNVMSKIDETIQPLFKKMRFNSAAIQNLVRIRDVLLPRLMSGELRVNI